MDAVALWKCTSDAQSLACDHLGTLQAHANAAVSALCNVLAALAMDAVLLCEFVPTQGASLRLKDSYHPKEVVTC